MPSSFYSKKKAQSLSINTMIIIILALIVLVILIYIVGTNVKNLNRTTNSCAAKTGTCEPKGCTITQINQGKSDCPEDSVCCVDLFNNGQKKETAGSGQTGGASSPCVSSPEKQCAD